ncbi:AI-2E family transporter [Gaetbulibacter sp. M235]|uniref:AI-2E family transporter n=1 Tax=Gaetbulibacter sp. M235 TaxID=3126510 RepID=UPI00374F50D4
MNSKNQITHSAFSLLSLIAVVFILFILKPLIMPILYASILAIMIFPVQMFLEKKLRCNRLFASLFSITIIFCVTALLGIMVYFQLNSLINNSEIYIAKLTTLYYNFIEFTYNTLGINKGSSLFTKDLRIESLLKGRFDKIGEFIYQSGSLFSYFVLIPIYLFFFLYYRRFFRLFYYKLFRSKPKAFLNRMIRKVYKIQQNYLLGLIKVIIIVGCLNSIGLLLLGIGNPFFFGFFAAFLLLIPYVGIFIGSILPAIIALATKDSAWYAFGVIAIFGFIQFLEGNFITPKITGSKVSINPFIAILSLIVFSMLWGIAGMIVALPITATLKIIFDNTPEYHAYGFLIGESLDEYLQSKATIRLKKWKKIRKSKHE